MATNTTDDTYAGTLTVEDSGKVPLPEEYAAHDSGSFVARSATFTMDAALADAVGYFPWRGVDADPGEADLHNPHLALDELELSFYGDAEAELYRIVDGRDGGAADE